MRAMMLFLIKFNRVNFAAGIRSIKRFSLHIAKNVRKYIGLAKLVRIEENRFYNDEQRKNFIGTRISLIIQEQKLWVEDFN